MQCEVQDSTGNSIQKFWLANRSINSSAIQSSYGQLPPALGCAVSGQKLQCDFQDGRGHVIQRFWYDGKNVEVKNARTALGNGSSEAGAAAPIFLVGGLFGASLVML